MIYKQTGLPPSPPLDAWFHNSYSNKIPNGDECKAGTLDAVWHEWSLRNCVAKQIFHVYYLEWLACTSSHLHLEGSVGVGC